MFLNASRRSAFGAVNSGYDHTPGSLRLCDHKEMCLKHGNFPTEYGFLITKKGVIITRRCLYPV